MPKRREPPPSECAGGRLYCIVLFVLVTFGVFVYMQATILNDATHMVDVYTNTAQGGVRKKLRGVEVGFQSNQGDTGGSKEPSANDNVFIPSGRLHRDDNSDSVGSGTRNIVPSSSNHNNGVVSGGFLPRVIADDVVVAKKSNTAPERPSKARAALSRYVEIDLLQKEGNDVGNWDHVTAEECAKECDANRQCHSFSYRFGSQTDVLSFCLR